MRLYLIFTEEPIDCIGEIMAHSEAEAESLAEAKYHDAVFAVAEEDFRW